jgi:transcriptional regulator with XRE-family HTH domain
VTPNITSFQELFDRAETSSEYWRASATIDFAEDLFRLMDEAGVSRAELARRLGTSPAYVTQVLRADGNFTLETMTRFATALGHQVRIHLAPMKSVTTWHDCPPEHKKRSEATGLAGLPTRS